MNTPNPNPSPELREAVEAEVRKLKGADSPWAIGIRERLRAALALSPQTAPGEGPDPQEYLDFADAMHAKLFHPSGANRDDCKPHQIAKLLVMSIRILANALATVAAANDEGVAEQALSFAAAIQPHLETLDLHNCSIGAARECIVGEFTAAIRLLSQGAGK